MCNDVTSWPMVSLLKDGLKFVLMMLGMTLCVGYQIESTVCMKLGSKETAQQRKNYNT